MTAEQDLLRRLRELLAGADVDAAAIVDAAWQEAQDEVQSALRRLMVHELLERTSATLEARQATAPAKPSMPPRPDEDTGAGERTQPASGGTASANATYLFGIGTVGLQVPERVAAPPFGSGQLRMVEHDRLRAVVCDVDPAIFEAMTSHDGADLEALAEAARAHDAILAEFAALAPVIPLRLGTVVADDAAVEGLLARHADRLQRELARIAGHAEWTVTVYPDATAPDMNARSDAPIPASSGREYLEHRRTALAEREERREHHDAVASAIHTELAAVAADAQRVEARPVEDGEPPLLYGVYFIADEARDRFHEAIDGLRRQHPEVAFAVSGPWPAYHFVRIDLASRDMGAR